MKLNKKEMLSSIIFLTLILSTGFSSILFKPISTISKQSPQNENLNDNLPKISAIGEEPWWNASFQWRQPINVTNPGTYNLTNNWVKITFNWKNLYDAGKIQNDLDDIRIVENGMLRRYHVRKDFPSANNATVWFETNCTAGTSEYDTYLYYGNSIVGRATAYYYENCPDGNLWYTFEEGAGNIAYDEMKNYDADFYGTGGGPNYITGKIGQYALQFDETSKDYLAIKKLNWASENGTNGLSQLTVSCWFKTSYSGGEWDNWALFDFDRSEYFNLFVRGDDGRIGFSSSSASGGTMNDFTSNTAGLNDGAWHFVSIVYDGNDKIIYIDGNEDNRWVNAHNGYGIGTGTTRYGFLGDGSEASTYDGSRNNLYYEGAIDEMRYFNFSLEPKDIQWLANYYPITTNLLSEQERSASVTVIVKDVDGRRVPGAEVTIWNKTQILNVPGVGDFSELTNANGVVTFTKVPFGKYNITVNYTLKSGLKEEIVYDSRTISGGGFEFKGLVINETVYTNLWTIDFEVKDVDGQPLSYGLVKVNDSTQVLETLTLDSNGRATFRWLNTTSYKYEVFYNNSDYVISNPTLVNYSTIFRKDFKKTYLINQTNTKDKSLSSYTVSVSTFLPGSNYTSRGELTVIDAYIYLKKMTDNLTQVIVSYANATDYNFKELRTYSSAHTSDSFIYHPSEEESYDVYGVKLVIEGENQTRCNGVIEVILTHAYTQKVTVNMAKLNIKVIDSSETVPVEGVTVRIEVNGTRQLVTSLKTDDNGFAYGLNYADLPFWYTTGVVYNISLWIVNTNYIFHINQSDQFFNPDKIYSYYNYTLNNAQTLIFEINLDFLQYITEFKNGSLVATNDVKWGEMLSFSINFTISSNGGTTWAPDNNQGTTITLTVKSTSSGNPIVYSKAMTFTSNGTYILQVNSSKFSAGTTGKSYIITISGVKNFYRSPDDVVFTIYIRPIPTGISLHNYTTLTLISSNEISQYYNKLINATLKFYNNETNEALVADTFTYSWDYGSGTVSLDPIHPEYYTITINTANAPNVGKYRVEISVALENYSTINTYGFFINILSRPTVINNVSTLLQSSPQIYIFEAKNFTFEYRDVLDDIKLTNIETATYYWYKLDENGNPLSGPGNEGSGNLMTDSKGNYVLDFDTETKDIGTYTLFVTLQKKNHEVRNAFITLTIKYRPISVFKNITGLSGNEVHVVQGTDIKFSITLTDPTNESQLLTGANVTLTIGTNVYVLTETAPGTYTFTFSTENIDAFFIPNTLTGQLLIQKENYETQTIPLTIVVGMTEIFPGFPMFYFLLIIGGIVAVVGSVVTYRTIQRARIPTFVKKVRSMKKLIKGRKSIPDSLLYPTKEEYIVKMFEDRWDMLGLSLKDVMGLELKQKRKSNEKLSMEGGEA